MKSSALRQTSFYTQLIIEAKCISVYWAQDDRLEKMDFVDLNHQKVGIQGGKLDLRSSALQKFQGHLSNESTSLRLYW